MLTSERLIALALGGVIAAGLSWAILHMSRARQRLERAWGTFAQRSGLQLVRDKYEWPRLTGRYAGVPVQVEAVLSGITDTPGRHTVVTATCRCPLPNDFALHSQGMFSAIQRATGGQDIQMGDTDFDRAFVIECADEQAARALLADHALREQLLALAAGEPSLSVQDGVVAVEREREVTRGDTLARMLETASATAKALEASPSTPAVQQQAHAEVSTQHWFLERDGKRVALASMTVLAGLPVALIASGLLPDSASVFGWPIGIAVAAIGFKLLWPRRPRLTLSQQELRLERGKQTLSFPLGQCRFQCGPWHKSGYFCGSILYVQSGDRQLVIAGAMLTFHDERTYQVPAASEGDVVMRRESFAQLLNGLGYAAQQLKIIPQAIAITAPS